MSTIHQQKSASSFNQRARDKEQYEDTTVVKVDSPSIQKIKAEIENSSWYKKPRS